MNAIKEGRHPRHSLLYEFHSNQTGNPDKVGSALNVATGSLVQVLMHCLGHWRLSPGLHDLAFLPHLTSLASNLLVQHKQVMSEVSSHQPW